MSSGPEVSRILELFYLILLCNTCGETILVNYVQYSLPLMLLFLCALLLTVVGLVYTVL